MNADGVHRFRSKVLGMTTFGDLLIVATERGTYTTKDGKRYRKLKPVKPASSYRPIKQGGL